MASRGGGRGGGRGGDDDEDEQQALYDVINALEAENERLQEELSGR